jgi:penicillin amidase
VWEFDGSSRGRWIVPFGASDRPDDPHFLDQLPLWAAGELVPIVTDWSLLTPEDIT